MNSTFNHYFAPITFGIFGWLFFLLYWLVMYTSWVDPMSDFYQHKQLVLGGIGFLSVAIGFVWGVAQILMKVTYKQAWAGMIVSMPLLVFFVVRLYFAWHVTL